MCLSEMPQSAINFMIYTSTIVEERQIDINCPIRSFLEFVFILTLILSFIPPPWLKQFLELVGYYRGKGFGKGEWLLLLHG